MGSKLAVAAVAVAVVAAARTAVADNVDDLVKQGGAAYSDGKYEDAIDLFTRAYAIDRKKETLYALAQAERLGGHCPSAVTHYKKLLDQITDLDTTRRIESNIALCEHTEAVGKPGATTTTPPPPPKEPEAKTTVRVERRGDPVATTFVTLGALAIGGGVALFVAGEQAYSDSRTAPTLGQHDSLQSRGDVMRVSAIAAAGLGVGLVTLAIVRWTGKHGERATVSLAPTRSGTVAALTVTW